MLPKLEVMLLKLPVVDTNCVKVPELTVKVPPVKLPAYMLDADPFIIDSVPTDAFCPYIVVKLALFPTRL